MMIDLYRTHISAVMMYSSRQRAYMFREKFKNAAAAERFVAKHNRLVDQFADDEDDQYYIYLEAIEAEERQNGRFRK